jgi:TolB protein
MNSPAIAPDRSAIVYSSTREDAVDLWRLDLADNRPVGEARRLTRQPGSCANPHFSPDGSWVIYHGVIEGQRDIWVVSSEGGTPINLTSNDAVDVQPVWSPDGSRIGFTSDRSGSHEIWVAGIEDGRLAGLGKQLTTTDGIATSPSWSADSTQIAFILYSDQDSDLYVVDVMDPGEPRRLTSGASAASVAWDYLSGDILVKGLWGDLSYTVRAVDPVTGSITPRPIIAPLSSTANMGSLRVSIDGKLVAWVEEEHHSDLWLLEGGQWRF